LTLLASTLLISGEIAKAKPKPPVNTSLLAQPGTLGFLVVFGMAVILFFVFRSMSKQLRKVNDAARAEEDAARAAAAPSGSASAG
jgi:Na+-transporting methylmalonyl-CoA/oxaloacetate decarboxylase gamma subunit